MLWNIDEDAMKSSFGLHFPEGTQLVQEGGEGVLTPTTKYTLGQCLGQSNQSNVGDLNEFHFGTF